MISTHLHHLFVCPRLLTAHLVKLVAVSNLLGVRKSLSKGSRGTGFTLLRELLSLLNEYTSLF